jgi:hypothetical protein
MGYLWTSLEYIHGPLEKTVTFYCNFVLMEKSAQNHSASGWGASSALLRCLCLGRGCCCLALGRGGLSVLGLAEDSLFAAALHSFNSWLEAAIDWEVGETYLQTSLLLCRACPGLPSMVGISGCLFVLLACFIHTQNILQGTQHLIFLWNLSVHTLLSHVIPGGLTTILNEILPFHLFYRGGNRC